jgi:hypothetical protein
MDGARLSRNPHLSWFGFRVGGMAGMRPLTVTMRGLCHVVSLTLSGHHDIRWMTQGREHRWGEDAGTVHFIPADDEPHTFVTTTPGAFTSIAFSIPRRHLGDIAGAEGVAAPAGVAAVAHPRRSRAPVVPHPSRRGPARGGDRCR